MDIDLKDMEHLDNYKGNTDKNEEISMFHENDAILCIHNNTGSAGIKTDNSAHKVRKRIMVASDGKDKAEEQIKLDNIILDEVKESTGIKPSLFNDTEDELEDKVTRKNHNTKSKYFKLIDTDSEPENGGNESIDELIEAPAYILNNKKDLLPEKNIAEGLAALCDPDSSDDENQIQPLAYKKKPKKKGEELEKRMTAKEAAEQRKEIESVSQRMLRETHVSLPYHKPKQRSLKEFLQNRPRFASTVPANIAKVPAAIAIKMNHEQLEVVSKKMAEREQLVKEFYKSESEEEEEEENDTISKDGIDNSHCANNINNTISNNYELTESGGKLLLERDNQSVPSLSETVVDELQVTKIEKENCKSNGHESMGEEVPRLNDENNMQEDNTTIRSIRQSSLSDIDEDNDTSISRQVEDQCLKDDGNTDVEQISKKSVWQLLKKQLGDSKPKLSGAPNYVIDLDDGTVHLDEVTNLKHRFLKHTTKKTYKKASAVELDVLCVSQGGDIHKEKIAVKIEEHEEPKIEEKPGVKYRKLKDDLQAQMAMRRNELWKEKQARLQAEEEANADDDVYKGEREDCGIDDILDDEEEEFSDAGSDEEEEDEKMENENETAEQSGMLDNESSEDADVYEQQENRIVGGTENELEMAAPKKTKKLRRLKRIVQPADSDSEEDPERVQNQPTQNADKNEKNMDSTVSWPDEDEMISAGQTNSCQTPKKQSCQQSKSELSFLSPVCRLTGLQSFDAANKLFQNSPGSPAIRLGEPSPFKNANGWSKSLFHDSPMKSNDNLEDLCSGKFPSQPITTDQAHSCVSETRKDGKGDESLASIASSQSSQNIDPTTQDLLELCSGNFGFTQTGKSQDTITGNQAETVEVCRDIVIGDNIDTAKELPIDEDEDKFISQLIDDDELENFKKKFESPLQSSCNSNVADERIAKKIAFEALNGIENSEYSENSDDDDISIKIKSKRMNNKIMDSDEEDVSWGNDADENIDLHDEEDSPDDDTNDDEGGQEGLNQAELGYDSEENEILVEKPVKAKKFKLKDFLENEAEISESEWGSEDEDERNLDELEIEIGDEDEFDQDKLKDDLEKIHMRRVLDEDKRSLKVLQEIFLGEDEDLKGAGRQRQFRWKNIDNVENDESATQEIEESTFHDDDVENEEGWRKKRYERELFLQSLKQNDSDDESTVPSVVANSRLFKLGKRAMVFNERKLKNTMQHVNIKQPYALNTQRGSFLSRKDGVLNRIAEYTKVNDVVLGAPRNTRNFVFQSVTKTSDGASVSTNNFQKNKRDAGDVGTPTQLKRLRLNGFSPANQKKTEKKSKARLFCNSQW